MGFTPSGLLHTSSLHLKYSYMQLYIYIYLPKVLPGASMYPCVYIYILPAVMSKPVCHGRTSAPCFRPNGPISAPDPHKAPAEEGAVTEIGPLLLKGVKTGQGYTGVHGGDGWRWGSKRDGWREFDLFFIFFVFFHEHVVDVEAFNLLFS